MTKQTAKRFTDLIVWQKAHKFVLAVYRFTMGFPKEEIYGLTSQLRRAAISIVANIVEGFKKTGSADKIRFMNISPPKKNCFFPSRPKLSENIMKKIVKFCNTSRVPPINYAS